MADTRATPLAIHPFETAGLGLAPFRCIDVIERVFVACQGAPRQPGGTCAFCGTGIMSCFVIKSKDGRKFEVGCDCVARTLTACAKTDVERVARQLHESCNKVKTARANARKDARIAAAVAALADNREALDARIYDGVVQHSHGPRSVAQQAEWMLGHGGRALKMRGAELIEACIETNKTTREIV